MYGGWECRTVRRAITSIADVRAAAIADVEFRVSVTRILEEQRKRLEVSGTPDMG